MAGGLLRLKSVSLRYITGECKEKGKYGSRWRVEREKNPILKPKTGKVKQTLIREVLPRCMRSKAGWGEGGALGGLPDVTESSNYTNPVRAWMKRARQKTRANPPRERTTQPKKTPDNSAKRTRNTHTRQPP